MCKCTPEIRTPFCGKPGCNDWPVEGASQLNPDFYPVDALLRNMSDKHFGSEDVLRRGQRYEDAFQIVSNKLDEYKKQIEDKDKIIARLLEEDK